VKHTHSPAPAVALPEPERRRPPVPDAVAGTLLFLFTEVMLFAGLISAHIVYVANQVGVLWPPPDQPLLPFRETARNSGALLLSGVALFLAWRAYRTDRKAALWLLGTATALGGLFVAAQGVEWWALLRQGLTLDSGPYAAFFYLIIGGHALHAVVGLGVLGWAFLRLRQGRLAGDHFAAAQLFWYFVVLLWPFLFLQVYGS